MTSDVQKIHHETECVFAGIDFGTSGCRISVIDGDERELFSDSVRWHQLAASASSSTPTRQPHTDGALAADPSLWLAGLHRLMAAVPVEMRRSMRAIAVDGTSATVLLVDTTTGKVTRGCRLYNWSALDEDEDEAPAEGPRAWAMAKAVSPPGSPACSPTSSFVKCLTWLLERPLDADEKIAHQCDFVLAYLRSSEEGGPMEVVTDWNNALKIGYDCETLSYPPWLKGHRTAADPSMRATLESLFDALPPVVAPGEVLGHVAAGRVEQWSLPADCRVVSGTTDSIAAFLAAGASRVGDAVTTLGSTLAIKLLTPDPVEDAQAGVYSHRIPLSVLPPGDRSSSDPTTTDRCFLAGGASNVGCAVLVDEGFSDDELRQLSAQIDPETDSPLDYYPMRGVGERFPFNDPHRVGRLQPKPGTRKEYLHGILQGIASVEVAGYAKLKKLGGAPKAAVRRVFTAGGGAQNDVWRRMRERMLGVPVIRSEHTDSAYGAALLAKRALDRLSD
ncbi:unnamed protein product [Vitrella brassicaformis CCMP3155]|uniref:Carbohydrate kinase FGGY C-terminal domain-containing protein n=2 Tax=Vitrella brassicaformis TaxID=1169539 RepID=A0A0G4H317_VITBC|nr:unnamed protein product [Vitrella brassicaformis CCMP3155]|eukprot:CEM37977.1 unnamed protein product [Vitrella brassicaformis CCMP3155]